MIQLTDIPQAGTRPDDGIRVTELPDLEFDPTHGVLGAVMAAYRLEGFEAGRASAVHDMLAALVPLAEDFLRRHPQASPELRSFVYAFGASLEQHLTQCSANPTFVEGGLGI